METRPQRTWFKQDDGPTRCRIFLVHTPLTFGHSQLIFSVHRQRLKEAARFEKVAKIIKSSISAFQQVLGSEKVHRKNSEFKTLAEITRTKGKYIKTLILRTSADEKRTEYKIHLVPYFESHASNCKSRYKALHFIKRRRNSATDKTGGLLAWLGERETEVDRWLKDPHPWAKILDQKALKDWKMDKLATLLKEKMIL